MLTDDLGLNITVPVRSADEAFDVFERVINEWRVTLELDTWRMNVIRNDDEQAFATCLADATYQKAELTANAKLMFEHEFSPLHIESVAVHELTHAVLWLPFNQLINPKLPEDIASHFEETTTEHVASALLRAKYSNRAELRYLWSRYQVIGKNDAGEGYGAGRIVPAMPFMSSIG